MKKIYTHSIAADIVELFEDVLSRYDISVPSPEDDDRDPEDMIGLYGSTYYDLLDTVESMLADILKQHDPSDQIIMDEYGDEYEEIAMKPINTITRYIVVGRYGTMLEHPEVCKTKNEAIKYIQEIMVDDLCADYDDNMQAEGIDMDNMQAILNWGKDHDYIQGDDNSYCYTSGNDWHEYIIHSVDIEIE